MARIRTVKPVFLRHEQLQDLEYEHPGKYIMMVFMGLWMLADSKGRFEYKPRSIKLDILPFLDFDMQVSLEILEHHGFIRSYVVKGQKFGLVLTFRKHQRITGKELTEGEKFPAEPNIDGVNLVENNQESIGKHPDVQERKGKEEEGEEESEPIFLREEKYQSLSESVMKYFGFNEVANFDKLREVFVCLKCLDHEGRIEYFEKQFVAYVEFKCISNSFSHSFKKFLGTPAELFQDGAWNAESWINKLAMEKEKRTSNHFKIPGQAAKGVEAAMDWGQVERRSKSS